MAYQGLHNPMMQLTLYLLAWISYSLNNGDKKRKAKHLNHSRNPYLAPKANANGKSVTEWTN